MADVPGLRVLLVPPGARSNDGYLAVLLDTTVSEPLKAELRSRDDIALGGHIYEVPLHRRSVFRYLATGPLPVAEDLRGRHICPPIYPSLTSPGRCCATWREGPRAAPPRGTGSRRGTRPNHRRRFGTPGGGGGRLPYRLILGFGHVGNLEALRPLPLLLARHRSC
ncbi:hypothetical protein DLJ47_05065 [Micromonospora sp. S4605]|nr:hypothetical protein DLJ47_05065 [Micromonospora sp. S4605]